jgi:hypothetical protein
MKGNSLMRYIWPQRAAELLGTTSQEVPFVLRDRYPGLCHVVGTFMRVERRALADLIKGRDPRVVLVDGLAEFLAATKGDQLQGFSFFCRRLAKLYPPYLDQDTYGRLDCRVPSTIVKRILEDWQGGMR